MSTQTSTSHRARTHNVIRHHSSTLWIESVHNHQKVLVIDPISTSGQHHWQNKTEQIPEGIDSIEKQNEEFQRQRRENEQQVLLYWLVGTSSVAFAFRHFNQH